MLSFKKLFAIGTLALVVSTPVHAQLFLMRKISKAMQTKANKAAAEKAQQEASLPQRARSLTTIGMSVPSGYEGTITWADDATRFFRSNVQKGEYEKAIKFLEAGAVPYPDGTRPQENPGYKIVADKRYDVLDVIAAKFPNYIKCSQLIHYACRNSDSTMIDYLVGKGASLDMNGFLIRPDRGAWAPAYGWNADQRFRYLPIDCAKKENYYYLKRKYGKNRSADAVSRIALIGIEKNDTAILNSMFNEPNFNPDVNVGNLGYHTQWTYHQKWTNLLCAAIEKRNMWAIRQLIEHGADVNVVLSYGSVNPLLLAVTRPAMQDVIELLLSKGAKTTFQYHSGARMETKNVLRSALDEYKEWFILNGYMK